MPEIIVALDDMETNGVLFFAQKLSSLVWGFKINDALLEAGAYLIPRLKYYGHVFCDPKLYDTPQTVVNSVNKLARSGADMISAHASGDIKSLIAAVSRKQKSKIIGVGALTSDTHRSSSKFRTALFNVLVARADGMIVTAREAKRIRKNSAYKNLVLVTPGIRPAWWHDAGDDQKQTATPSQAVGAGTDFLVIGRPITHSPDPIEAVKKILKELETQG